MSRATKATQPGEQVTATSQRWRWYHAVAFYVVIQGLTFFPPLFSSSFSRGSISFLIDGKRVS
jgi:hypothetical protein